MSFKCPFLSTSLFISLECRCSIEEYDCFVGLDTLEVFDNLLLDHDPVVVVSPRYIEFETLYPTFDILFKRGRKFNTLSCHLLNNIRDSSGLLQVLHHSNPKSEGQIVAVISFEANLHLELSSN